MIICVIVIITNISIYSLFIFLDQSGSATMEFSIYNNYYARQRNKYSSDRRVKEQ